MSAAAKPDAWLIGLCRDLAKVQRDRFRPQAPNQTERQYNRAVASSRKRMEALVCAIVELPATTEAEVVSLARVLRQYPADTLIDDISDQTQGRLILHLVAGLTGEPYPAACLVPRAVPRSGNTSL